MNSCPEDDGRDEKYLNDGPRSRILLSLKSGLPNEIDWALNKLIKISYHCNSNFHIDVVPGLLDVLLSMTEPFFKSVKLNTSPDDYETTLAPDAPLKLPLLDELSIFTSRETDEMIEKVTCILHVLRNLSFLEQNARFFASNYYVISMVAKGIALPCCNHYIEVKQHCLCIVENMASFLQLEGPQDSFLVCLRGFIDGNDRGLIIPALRALTKLCASEVNEKIFVEMEKRTIARANKNAGLEGDDQISASPFLGCLLRMMLSIHDEELVTSIVDYLYQYSCLGTEACNHLVQSTPGIGNVPKFLARFVYWKSGYGLQAVFGHKELSALRGPSHDNYHPPLVQKPPTLSNADIARRLASQHRPLAALVEMKQKIQYIRQLTSKGNLTPAVMQAYGQQIVDLEQKCQQIRQMHAMQLEQQSLTSSTQNPAPVPSATPGIISPDKSAENSNAPVAVASSSGDKMNVDIRKESKPGPPPTKKSVNSSASPKKDAPDKKECWWGRRIKKRVEADGKTVTDIEEMECACKVEFETEQELEKHVLSVHLAESLVNDGSVDNYKCRWKGCTLMDKINGPISRNRAILHLRTHYPLGQSKPKPPAFPAPPRSQPTLSIMADLDGIALTTLLLIRNLTRANGGCKDALNLLITNEDELVMLMFSQIKHAKYTSEILSHLYETPASVIV